MAARAAKDRGMLERLQTTAAFAGSTVEHYDWDMLVQEDRVHRLIYTDPAIFAAEMTHIFGAVWVYLGHESQIPRDDDFITVRLGLRPLILLRDSNGKLRALFNRCSNRYRTGLTPRNFAQDVRNVRSGTPISPQSQGTLIFRSVCSRSASSKRTMTAA